MNVALKNSATGEIKLQKIGWSWTLFFFAGLFGVPLFLRKLNGFGVVAVTLLILTWTGQAAVVAMAFIVMVVGQIWLALRGNALTGNALLQSGWEFANPESIEARLAQSAWKTTESAGSNTYKKVVTNAKTADRSKLIALGAAVVFWIFCISTGSASSEIACGSEAVKKTIVDIKNGQVARLNPQAIIFYTTFFDPKKTTFIVDDVITVRLVERKSYCRANIIESHELNDEMKAMKRSDYESFKEMFSHNFADTDVMLDNSPIEYSVSLTDDGLKFYVQIEPKR